MTDQQKASGKDAFNRLIRMARDGQRQHKINWIPTGDQADRDALNRALRRAGGKDAPEPEPPPLAWKSVDLPDDDAA